MNSHCLPKVVPNVAVICRGDRNGRAPVAALAWLCLAATAAFSPAALLPTLAAHEPPETEAPRFARDIRPLLADKCFRCHGPDERHREAGLRLDTEDGARAALESGTVAIVPGDVPGSELVRRVTAEGEERMPPADSGKELSAAEVELLRRWVAAGADYEPHWSLAPVVRPQTPAVQHSDWAANEVDRFLLASWERSGMAPSPDADHATLIRRVYLDLTGLPPTPAQSHAYLSAPTPQRLAEIVDELLASPAHAERLAVYWLDLVRYADTVGYHGDQEHAAAPYRDWVIHALYENMPFDQFTIEQLAGDLLPSATAEQKIASCYNRLLQTSHEGGVQVKEYLHKYDADRIRNLGGTWLGATLGCAECHSHKFDPYTQRDFYRLVAFFADVDDSRTFKGGDTNPTKREPELSVLSPLDQLAVTQLAARIRALESDAKSEAAPRTEAGAATDTAAQLALLRAKLAERSQPRRCMVTESVAPRPIRILSRGDFLDDSGEIVEPGIPSAPSALGIGVA